MPIKILVTGDVHIGRRSTAIAPDSSFGSVKYTWGNLIKLAIDRKVNVMALTGDIVEKDNSYFEAIGAIQSGFRQLEDNNIEVFIVAGNHDYDVLAEILDTHVYPHIHFLGRNQKWEQQEFKKDGMRILFTGWSFSSRYVMQDPLVSYELATESFEGPVIGMIHGDVDLPKSNYAPLSSTEFHSKGVDVWLLGHIHKRQIIREESPMVLYPGSPQALSPKEKGEHGPVLLSIESKQQIDYELINISPVQYEFLRIDVTELEIEEMRGEMARRISENTDSMNLDYQKVLLYDVLLEGTHENVRAVERELERADEIEQNVGDVSIGIRTIDFSGIKAKVDNLQELARQSSPVGIIAEILLALDEGQQNAAVTSMRGEIKESIGQMNSRSTYVRIRSFYEQLESEEEYIDNIIRHQCNQLLSELISQKKDV